MPVYNAPMYPPAGYQASDYGYKAMAYDPVESSTTSSPLANNGQVYTSRIILRQRALISNVILQVFTAGATLTANQCIAGLYNSSGTLLSSTANQATNWQSAGTKVMALTAAQDCAPGAYDVAFYANGTTRPAFLRANPDFNVNLGLATAAWRFATADTGRTTTLPSPLGTKVVTNLFPYWSAVS